MRRENFRLLVSMLLGCAIFAACQKEEKTNEAALKMQEFVVAISDYARSYQPNFIVVPQNGIELAYTAADPEKGLNQEFLDAIDGIGVEELFYNGSHAPDEYRLDMLRELVLTETILVSEYVKSESDLPNAISESQSEGFICFPRHEGNYYYEHIPAIVNENANPVNVLADVQNYLYLISTDQYASKTAFVESVSTTNFDLIIMDAFFEQEPFSNSEIDALKVKANGAPRLVIAYMNIGAAENYRYYWQAKWRKGNPSWLKKKYDGYADEIWVEYWNESWQQIIFGNDSSYLKKILDAGFDGVYLDNTEAYYFLYHNR